MPQPEEISLMHKIQLGCAIVGTAIALTAQCTGAPPAQTISTRADFGASFYYGATPPSTASLVQFSDWTIGAPISITSMRALTYDQGVGNPVVPNQVGATGVVNIYTCATTWTGNQLLNPTTNPPGAPWTLAGTGQITVVAYPAESPITFATPVALTAGTYGVALEWLATTSGPNPGALHTLGVSPNNIPTASDSYVSITNQGIQQTGWTSGVNTNTGLNLRVSYTPAANSGYFAQFGDGCYFHPRGFYENFPESPTPPDLQNTGMQWIRLGPNNYLVAAGPNTIIPPANTSITAGAFTGSSSASWDDAYLVQTLPFTGPFPYAGGSTSSISIGSNGYIFLGSATSTSFQTCGAAYGLVPPWRDEMPRIAPYYHDLDPTVGGGIFYEVDPSVPPQYVRITWNQVQEWGVPAAVNTMQLTLNANGDVGIAYGVLANQSATNNAIAGFSEGNGARLPAPQDLSATMPFQSGNGDIPPVLSMSARPVLGTTPTLITTNITPGTLFVFLATGFGTIPAGVPLNALGMPGCKQYINPVSSLLLPVITGQASAPLAIPNVPAYLGLVVSSQSAPLTPGLNVAGILTSNGLCMKVGL